MNGGYPPVPDIRRIDPEIPVCVDHGIVAWYAEDGTARRACSACIDGAVYHAEVLARWHRRYHQGHFEPTCVMCTGRCPS